MSSIIKISNEIANESISSALKNIIKVNKQNDKNTQTNNKKIVMKESKKRSCLKSITWRILATLTTVSISYFYLNDMSVAAKIGALDSSIKFIIAFPTVLFPEPDSPTSPKISPLLTSIFTFFAA